MRFLISTFIVFSFFSLSLMGFSQPLELSSASKSQEIKDFNDSPFIIGYYKKHGEKESRSFSDFAFWDTSFVPFYTNHHELLFSFNLWSQKPYKFLSAAARAPPIS